MNEVIRKSFLSATAYLTDSLWRAVFSMTPEQQENCEEIRIRVGRPSKAYVNGKYITLTDKGVVPIIKQDDINNILSRLSNKSFHTYSGQIKNGFITTPEGHRVGLAGEAVYRNGEIITLKNITSLNLRIAKPYYGMANKLLSTIYFTDLHNTLVISKPGAGKTTLLRDISKYLSEKHCVSIVDERYELAGFNSDAKHYFNIGDCDVFSGGNKDNMIEIAIRTMTPDVVVIDEITSEKDIETICKFSYSGCKYIASAHCNNIYDLNDRPLYKRLIEAQIFHRIIKIDTSGGVRSYTIYSMEDSNNVEDSGFIHDSYILLGNRFFSEQKL